MSNEQSQLRVRPLMVPERIVDLLLFEANSKGISPHVLILQLIRKELAAQKDPISNESIEAFGPSVKILVRLPEDLDADLEQRGGTEHSPSYIISQALAREFGKSKLVATA